MKTLLLILTALTLSLTAGAVNPDSWQRISQAVFPGVVIEEDASTVTLTAASRAEDAAIVPISIHAMFPQSEQRYITDIWLIIDQNPSPVAAHFSFTGESGQADIETRVRINEYTLIRAVARVNDGSYHQAVRFIKASGGCSAPVSRAAAKGIGSIKLYELSARPGRPALLQAQIRHPNDSGLAMDQLTRDYAPAHYVRSMTVSHGGVTVVTADLDISISENPEFEFYVAPSARSDLSVTFTDNTDESWSAQYKQ